MRKFNQNMNKWFKTADCMFTIAADRCVVFGGQHIGGNRKRFNSYM